MQKEISIHDVPFILTAMLTGATASTFVVYWMIDQGFFSNDIAYWVRMMAGPPGVGVGAWLWDELRKIKLPFTALLSVIVFAMLCFAGLIAARHI